MKILLVAEYREGKLQGSVNDLMAFAKKLGAESAMFLVGSETDLPKFARDAVSCRCEDLR